MRVMSIVRLMVCSFAFTLAVEAVKAVNAQATGRERVLKVDAVELIDHSKEIEGKVDFQQQHGRYTYLLATADPAKYEIQHGGACGRMGPLSGEGSPSWRIVRFEGEAEQECGEFTVHWHGSTTTMAIDGAGRCRVMSYRGRGPDSTIGDIEKTFSKFHIPDRHELPGHVETTFNGKRVPELSGDYDNQTVNDHADAARFEVPADLKQ